METRCLQPQNRLFHLLVLVLLLAACGCSLVWSGDLEDGSSPPQLRNLRLRRRKLQNGTPYKVVLFLAIKYLNNDVASQIETSEQKPSNEVAQHFCESVNFQASGNQVQRAAAAISAAFETRIIESGDTYNYDCSILQTNRNYDNDGEDLFEQGFFILEVAVEQIVYVQSGTALLSLQEVTKIVELGFNRGDGGRVRFRSQLQEHPAFATVLNVVVLDGSLSPPQEAPSAVPSALPTEFPSAFPSNKPSALPSFTPSGAPSLTPSSAPSQAPSLPPSEVPTASPTDTPSELPSSDPSAPPSTSPTLAVAGPGPRQQQVPADSGIAASTAKEEIDRQPLILGVIAGGVATIIVSCFFIFCVWFPFCGRKHGRQHDQTSTRNRRRSNASSNSSNSTHAAETMIPGVLTLDNDSQSLANTTVTLGERPSRAVYKSSRATSKKRVAAAQPISMLDSFDESSIYTSTFPASVTESELFQSSPPAMPTHHFGENSANIDIVMEESNEDESVSSSESDAFDKILMQKVDNDEEKKDDDLQDKEDAEQESDGEASKPGTKGYDPFDEDDESTFEFASSIALSDPSFGPPVKEKGANISISSTSTKTKRIENLLVEILPDAPSDDDRPEERKQEVEDSGRPYSSPVHSGITDYSGSETNANNSLLRSVLEDARRLAKQSSSSRSRASRKSAPSRLLAKEKRVQKLPSSGRPPRLRDLLKDNHQEADSAMSTSRSVGARPRSRFRSNGPKSIDLNSTGSQPSIPHSTKNGTSDTGRTLALVSPASSDMSSFYGRGTLGAQPREHLWDEVIEAAFVTPESSPGLLGIASHPGHTSNSKQNSSDTKSISNPWLSETSLEQTLGARPRDVDLGSPGSWSGNSHRSSKSSQSRGSLDSLSSQLSRQSLRSGRSGVDAIYGPPPGNLVNSSPPKNLRINESPIDEHKSSPEDAPLTPRSLENDLLGLEGLSGKEDDSEGDIFTASSFSASSAGASRSSRPPRPNTRKSNMKRVIVVAPPGKIGVVLANRHDGNGTVVSEVRPSSAVKGMLSPGDKLVAVDGDDVTKMVVSQITSMMASRSANERTLTVIPSSASSFVESQEEKHSGSP